LHRLNPVRLAFLRDHLVAHFGLQAADRRRPLRGLEVLDIGCGGGLLSEPLARMGARVVGLDAAERNVATARLHAEAAGLAIDYRHGTAEELAKDLAADQAPFDAVLAMEIVEHVADLDLFMTAAGRLVRPGGCFVAATLNRTARSFLAAIVGAEYVLGWLPRGTHRWDRFVKPSELARAARAAGLDVDAISGVGFDPVAGAWSLTRDPSVNYLLTAGKPG